MEITDQMHRDAMSRVQSGKVNDKSLNGSLSQYTGFIGEQVVMKYFDVKSVRYEYKGDKVYDYDLEVGQVKIDIKSLRRKSFISDKFEHAIPNYSQVMNCHLYIFVSVKIPDKRATEANIMGWCGHKWFWDNAEPVDKGVFRDNGMTHKADNSSIRYSQLKPIEDLIRRFH
jgi:hypothetical protein